MKIDIKLTTIEVAHLLILLEESKREGGYYRNRENYYKITNRLIALLEEKLGVSDQ